MKRQRHKRLFIKALFLSIGVKKGDILLAVVSGCMIALSLPGFNLSFLSWIAIVPLFIALKDKDIKEAFSLGLLSGLVIGIFILYFLPSTIHDLGWSYLFGSISLIVLVLYYAIYIGTFCVFVSLFRKFLIKSQKKQFVFVFYLLAIPSLWVSLEYINTHLLTSLPWTFIFLGYSQWNHINLIQIAEFTAVYGISFLIVLINLAVYLAISEKRFVQLGIVTLVCLLCYLYGWRRIPPPVHPEVKGGIRAAILQGNIEAETKWDQEKVDFLATRYLDLCREASRAEPDLIVWTETAIPWPLEDGDDLVEAVLGITKASNAYHLIGNPAPVAGQPHRYQNASYFVMPDGWITGQYNKMRLLALSEAAPVRSGSSMRPKTHMLSRSYVAGKEQVVLSTPLGEMGINICNENFYPDLIRNSVKNGAEFLVNMSNDAWLSGKAQFTTHYVMNIFRAIENRRETIVASNVGISGFIDAYGRVKNKTDILKAVCLVNEINRKNEMSFYARFGDLFSYLCIILSFSGIIYLLRRREKGEIK